jgi:MFS family permease
MLLRFLVGVAAVFFSTSSLALTAATFTGDSRSRIIGLQQATAQVVSVLAALVVGVAADILGWRSSFIVLALFSLAMIVAARTVTHTAKATTESGRIADIHFWRRLAPMLLTAALLGILTVIPMTQVPFLVSAVHPGSPIAISIVADLNFGSAAVSALLYARLKNRFGGSSTYALGLCVGAAGIAASGAANSLLVFSISSLAAGFGTGIYNSYLFDRGVELAGEAHQAEAAGLLFAMISFGAAVNPVLLGLFESAVGEYRALIGFAFAAVICGLFLDRLGSRAPRVRLA